MNVEQISAMANKLSIPQLQQAMRDGTLPPYVGIPILQQKVKLQQAAKNAQNVAQPQPPTVAEQVEGAAKQSNMEDIMRQRAAAMQADMGQTGGISDFLPKRKEENLARGGVVRFNSRGLVPDASFFDGSLGEDEAAALLALTPEQRAYFATLPEGKAQAIFAGRRIIQEQKPTRYKNVLPTSDITADTTVNVPYFRTDAYGKKPYSSATDVPTIPVASSVPDTSVKPVVKAVPINMTVQQAYAIFKDPNASPMDKSRAKFVIDRQPQTHSWVPVRDTGINDVSAPVIPVTGVNFNPDDLSDVMPNGSTWSDYWANSRATTDVPIIPVASSVPDTSVKPVVPAAPTVIQKAAPGIVPLAPDMAGELDAIRKQVALGSDQRSMESRMFGSNQPPNRETAPAQPYTLPSSAVAAKPLAMPSFNGGEFDKALVEKTPEEEYRKRMEDYLGPNTGIESLRGKLTKMEEENVSDKEKAPWMALLKAGLATMGGTSPYAAVNIGKGATEGVADYISAQKEFRKAQEKQLEIQSQLESAQRSERSNIYKYGVESKRADDANNRTVQLEKARAEQNLELRKLENAVQMRSQDIIAAGHNRPNEATFQQGYLDAILAGDTKRAEAFKQVLDAGHSIGSGTSAFKEGVELRNSADRARKMLNDYTAKLRFGAGSQEALAKDKEYQKLLASYVAADEAHKNYIAANSNSFINPAVDVTQGGLNHNPATGGQGLSPDEILKLYAKK